MLAIAAHVRLARFLAARGLSQAEAGRRLTRTLPPGEVVHRSHVCCWIAGRRTPTLRQAVAIERLTKGWDEGAIRPAEWVPVARSAETAEAAAA